MATAARTSFSHYDALQVGPGASHEEIERAFARQIRVFRLRTDNPLVHLARLNTAYRTLRDPLKRSAYDAAIGIESASRSWAPNDAGAVAPVQWVESRNESLPTAQTRTAERTGAEAAGEMRVASFIADALRQPATEPLADVPAGPSPIRERSAAPLAIEEPRSPGPLRQIEARAAQRSARPAPLLLGAAVAAFSIVAISLALTDQHRAPAIETSQPGTVTRQLPPATLAENASAQPATGAAAAIETAAARPAREKHVVATRIVPAPAAALANDEIASANTGDESPVTSAHDEDVQSAIAASTESPANNAPVAASSVRLPLPNSTISRTIERIGYACGEVVSITMADASAPKVYNVRCSSGDRYRATPLAGRYHFRRLTSATAAATATSDAAPVQNSGNQP